MLLVTLTYKATDTEQFQLSPLVFCCLDRCIDSIQFWSRLYHFVDVVGFYSEELFAFCPTTNLEDHPLSNVREFLFSIR